jgi:hypothetical protein
MDEIEVCLHVSLVPTPSDWRHTFETELRHTFETELSTTNRKRDIELKLMFKSVTNHSHANMRKPYEYLCVRLSDS